MSSSAVVITCDSETCHARLIGTNQEATEARARAQGWRIVPRRSAHCPACWKGLQVASRRA